MNSLEIKLKESNLETLWVVIYYYVDEFYQQVKQLVNRPGPRPQLSDSEVLTICIVGQMMSDSESAWYRYVRKNHSNEFPNLIERSRYHRRCKDLSQLQEIIRQMLVDRLGANQQRWHIMDSVPIPVCIYARASRNMRFCEEFAVDNSSLYGYCASKKESIYGFKLHLMVSSEGIPVHFVLAPAAPHDVSLAPEVLESYRQGITIGFDKGYVGLHKKLLRLEDYNLIVQQRNNQKEQLSKEEKSFLRQFRSIVETTNSLLSEQFNLQYTRAKSKRGLIHRVTAKIMSLTFAIFLNFLMGEPLLHVKQLIF